MQKGYNIKVYELDGTFERVLSPSVVMSGVSFSETVDGWQGELRLKLKLPFNTTDIGYNNIVRVYQTEENNAPRLIYAGIVGNIQRVNENSSEYIEVRVLGLASVLSMFYFYESGYAFSKTGTGDAIIEDIIDYFSTKYPGLVTYTGSSLEAVWSVNVAFDYTKCLDAIKNVTGLFSSSWWTIGPDGVFEFHPKVWGSSEVLHRLKVGVDVDKITVEENSERIVNKYMLKYASSTYIASDATSQTVNWLRELREDKSTEINDGGTATIAGDQYIAQNKDAKRKITIEVNANYDIESIRAGHFVTVQNIEYSISSLQVLKIEYNMDKIKLELEDFSSFGKEVFRS